MKPWQFGVMGLACLAAAACKSDPNIAILERELRLQEDKIYQLQACVDDYDASLESCRRENTTLRKVLAANETSEGSSAASKPPRANGAPPITPPVIVPPGESLSPEETRERFKAPAGPRQAPPHSPTRSTPVLPGPIVPGLTDAGGAAERSAADDEPAVAQRDSKQVAKIALNRMLTGGYSTGRRPGHEGVLVVIEPQDAEGKLVEAPADVSVVVVDPALEGSAGRVARWDFTSAEIATRFEKTIFGRGIKLEMPWPAAPPVHNDLHLFVRYTTGDGRKLEADRTIMVGQSGGPAHDWTPKDPSSAAEPAGPALQAARPVDSWKRAPTPATREADALPLRTASRPAELSPRVDEAPAAPPYRAGERPSRSAEPKVQRPVWSPERQ